MTQSLPFTTLCVDFCFKPHVKKAMKEKKKVGIKDFQKYIKVFDNKALKES